MSALLWHAVSRPAYEPGARKLDSVKVNLLAALGPVVLALVGAVLAHLLRSAP